MTRLSERAAPHSDDSGLSLIEVIIYVVILGIITTAIAAFFFSTWRAQATVTDQVDSTERGQLIATQIEIAMRNAVAFRITDATLAGDLPDGSTLLVATSMAGSNACMAFHLSGGDAQLTSNTGAHFSPPPWPTWQAGILLHENADGSTDYIFTRVDADVLEYSFDATSQDGATVHFEGRAYQRNTSGTLPGGGSQTCF